MIGTEPRPKEMAEQADWDERSSAGYYLLSQSLELNQRHHIMHLLPETDFDPAEETSKDDRGMGNEERNAGQF
ncbi:hypothetical protein CLOM_g14446 [Closterium sp. NIES-68]|nr:hypothetical protein CLOM_g14446 [Closterium sp. NIES-68]